MSVSHCEFRRKLLRRAADFYGTEALAADLGVKPRTFYRWLDGSRQPRSWSDVVARTRTLVIDRRAQLGILVQALRTVEGVA